MSSFENCFNENQLLESELETLDILRQRLLNLSDDEREQYYINFSAMPRMMENIYNHRRGQARHPDPDAIYAYPVDLFFNGKVWSEYATFYTYVHLLKRKPSIFILSTSEYTESRLSRDLNEINDINNLSIVLRLPGIDSDGGTRDHTINIPRNKITKEVLMSLYHIENHYYKLNTLNYFGVVISKNYNNNFNKNFASSFMFVLAQAKQRLGCLLSGDDIDIKVKDKIESINDIFQLEEELENNNLSKIYTRIACYSGFRLNQIRSAVDQSQLFIQLGYDALEAKVPYNPLGNPPQIAFLKTSAFDIAGIYLNKYQKDISAGDNSRYFAKMAEEMNADLAAIENKRLKLALEIMTKLKPYGTTLMVGGAVREIIMGVVPHDIDMATNVPMEKIESLFHTHDPGKSKKKGIYVVDYKGETFKIAHFRSDAATSVNGKYPEFVTFLSTFKSDVLRRDLAVNCIGIDVAGKIIDYADGEKDITSKMIKEAVRDPNMEFEEDYLRMLRAFRFAGKLGFKIDTGIDRGRF